MNDRPEKTLEELLVQIIDDVLDPEAGVDQTTSLEEIGLDSLTLTQVLLAVEEETGIWLDEKYLTREHLQNVETLAECLRNQRDGSGA